MASRQNGTNYVGVTSNIRRRAWEPSVYAPWLWIAARISRQSPSDRLWPARDGGDACAGDLDEAEWAHELDEIVDLLGRAGQFKK